MGTAYLGTQPTTAASELCVAHGLCHAIVGATCYNWECYIFSLKQSTARSYKKKLWMKNKQTSQNKNKKKLILLSEALKLFLKEYCFQLFLIREKSTITFLPGFSAYCFIEVCNMQTYSETLRKLFREITSEQWIITGDISSLKTLFCPWNRNMLQSVEMFAELSGVFLAWLGYEWPTWSPLADWC